MVKHLGVVRALRPIVLTAIALVSVHAAPAPAQPNPPRAQLHEDLRIDAERADLPRVSRIAVGPRGVIAIPLYAEQKIRVFDSTGKALATIGRKGAGPGEFSSISDIGWIGDTMWVTDVNQRRVSYFGPDWKLLRTVANPVTANKPVAGTNVPKKIGNFMVTNVQKDGALAGSAFLIGAEAKVLRRTDDNNFVRIDANGTARLLMRVPIVSDADERFHMITGGLYNPIPFVEAPSLAYSADLEHIATLTPLQTSATGGTITVALMKTTGATLFTRTFPYTGEPIPKAVRDSAIAAELKGDGPITEGPSNQRVQRHAIAKRKTPYIYPGALSVLLGMDNTVWLELRGSAEMRKYVMFNEKGDAIATVYLPKDTRLRQATMRNIWVTETDDDGLSSVVRYRVTGIPQTESLPSAQIIE